MGWLRPAQKRGENEKNINISSLGIRNNYWDYDWHACSTQEQIITQRAVALDLIK
jgi:hypothetical protein